MPLFSLLYTNAEEHNLKCFPIRLALTAEDYLAEMMLTVKGDLMIEFLEQIALVDVDFEDAEDVKIVEFDQDTESMVFNVSGSTVMVPLAKIAKRFGKFGKAVIDVHQWKLQQTDEMPACRHLALKPKAVPAAAAPAAAPVKTSIHEAPFGSKKRRTMDEDEDEDE
jgi:hypothetical protein